MVVVLLLLSYVLTIIPFRLVCHSSNSFFAFSSSSLLCCRLRSLSSITVLLGFFKGGKGKEKGKGRGKKKKSVVFIKSQMKHIK